MFDTSRLEHLPVTLFASIMGLGGLTLAWHAAESNYEYGLHLSPLLLIICCVVFVALVSAYATKFMRFREAVKKELAHPIKLNFFPAMSISLIIVATALNPYMGGFSTFLWGVGALIQLSFTLFIMSQWLFSGRFDVNHINPAWFIPVVGNILVPVLGASVANHEVSWFFFSIGIVNWVVLLTLLFKRKFFHSALPTKLIPTMFILIAPPAVGFISYIKLTGDLDAFARILYYSGAFVTLLLLANIRQFLKVPFFISWWAYTFPTAALTIATILMYSMTGVVFFKVISLLLLSALTLLVGYIAFRTYKGLASGKLLQPED